MAPRSGILLLVAALAGCDGPASPLQPVSLDIRPDSMRLWVGFQATVFASTTPVTPVIHFHINDTTIATMDDLGVVRARAPGVTYVVAKAGALRDSSKITVATPLLDLKPDSLLLRSGEEWRYLGIHTDAISFRGDVYSADVAIADITLDFGAGKNPRWIVSAKDPGVTYIIASGTDPNGVYRDSTLVRVRPPFTSVVYAKGRLR